MKWTSGLAISAALLLFSQASGQSVTYDWESGGDQGWGHKFDSDASETFPVVNIGGSNRMGVLRNGDFQEAERNTGNPTDPLYLAMDAASLAPALYLISYDYYIDTSGGGYGNFLQLGTYVTTGNGYYAQDFPGSGKDVELNGAQLASGQVFSGTISETFTQKGYAMPLAQTFFRLGLIINGDGPNATVYFDNVSVRPVPEPASLALAGLALAAVGALNRRSRS